MMQHIITITLFISKKKDVQSTHNYSRSIRAVKKDSKWIHETAHGLQSACGIAPSISSPRVDAM
jgi:hypothetical protein